MDGHGRALAYALERLADDTQDRIATALQLLLPVLEPVAHLASRADQGYCALTSDAFARMFAGVAALLQHCTVSTCRVYQTRLPCALFFVVCCCCCCCCCFCSLACSA